MREQREIVDKFFLSTKDYQYLLCSSELEVNCALSSKFTFLYFALFAYY